MYKCVNTNRKQILNKLLVRMKNRFSKMGKSLLGAMCLLSTCGLTYSCSDDYDLDETMPSFLGGSIYDELKARNFTTVVRLADDLGYANVLSRTGSKTLFVADDEAYRKFFETTDWKDGNGNPIRSYDQLSLAQKKMLFFTTMLDNADVLEMLPYSTGGGSLTMRRTTAYSAADSVRRWYYNELPVNKNVGEVDADGNNTGDKRFWDKYTTMGHPGIYMALDATSPMMLTFIEDQMKVKNITHDDVSFILNNKEPWVNGPEGGKRAYVYGAKVLKQDVTCLNGYFNILDTVLVTPPNMAEVIRTNGATDLFSKMLDRFSAPYYNSTLTAQYRQIYDIGNDSVFEKRYISGRSSTGAMTTGPDKKSLGDFPLLTYDPGWNQYAISSSTPKEQDMGAMFVPTDAAMIEYFVNGGGRVLMDRYAKLPNTPDNIEYNLYQIPLDILQALINNLMKDSFLESVPSKYLTIMNDAQDRMFPATNADYETEDKYKQCIDKCLLANNGVVYVMNRVITPADYASVIAPALYSSNTQIIKSVVRADDKYIEGNSYNNAPLQKYYSTYLKAMQSRFSFFVPTDEGLGSYGYVDPMSLARGNSADQKKNWKYWRFTYKNVASAVIPVRAEAYKYNIETGQNPESDQRQTIGGNAANVSEPNAQLTINGSGKIKKALLIDMLDQHIVVHDTDDDDNNKGVNGKRTYFLARTGAPVYVKYKGDASKNGLGMLVDGGYQLQLQRDEYANDHDCEVIEAYDMSPEKNGYGNGMTYLLNRPMQPTTKSVYAVMSEQGDKFSKFFDLCKANFSADQLILAGFQTEEMKTDKTLWASEQKKYRIFTDEGVNPSNNEMLVRFFNNYRYTVYVPTNEAIDAAKAKGLMSYDEIVEWMEAHREGATEETEGTLSPENQAKAKAMITMLINFLKYHFQDQSLFVDHVTTNMANADNADGMKYQTSCIDNVKNIYLSLHVKQSDNAITVTDNTGEKVHVIAPNNLMARDMDFDGATSGGASSIKNSSYIVLHQVDKVLNFASLPNGRYDSEWATAAAARSFVKKYRIR